MTKVISLRRKQHYKAPKQHKEKSGLKFNKIYVDKYKILFLFVSVFSIFLGALYFRLTDNADLIDVVSNNFIKLNSYNFKSIFMFLLKFDCIFMIMSFFVGTSFIGSILSFVFPMLKCIYIGFFSGYLYNEYELKGVLFCLLLLYPCFVITTTSLIFASNENMYMSQYIRNCLTNKNSTDNISIKLFLLRYFLLSVINVVCIAITSLAITFIVPKLNII